MQQYCPVNHIKTDTKGSDRTAFFPEGGGQYGDTGYLDEIRVTDTKEKDGVIFHIIDAPIEAGKSAHGKLDWEKRFDRMQQHSGGACWIGIVHHRFDIMWIPSGGRLLLYDGL